MNKYLEKLAGTLDDSKTELMQTATIGAAGFGTGALASRIGKRYPKALGDHAGRMGALIGGMGLIGDYAAVKINKALEKKPNNTYLNKAASWLTENKE